MSNSIQPANQTTPKGVAELPRAIQMPAPDVEPLVLKATQTTKERPVEREKFDPEKFQQALKDILERMNEQMKDSKRDLGFTMNDKINTFVVTVRNTETGEIIRQIPTEAVVKFADNLEDLKGILFNQTM